MKSTHTVTKTAAIMLLAVLALVVCGAAAAAVAGWRMDGTGVYADARPPQNIGREGDIAWKTPLPNWSNGSPILVGNRIFICAEPWDILCLDANTGKILWKRSNSYNDLETLDAATKQQLEAERVKDRALVAQMTPINKEIRSLYRQRRKNRKDPTINAQIKAKRKEIDALTHKRHALTLAFKYGTPPTHRSNGYTSNTLTSDGKQVYGGLGNGAAVCYDLDGTLKWFKAHPAPTDIWGESTSPVLAGDRVITFSRDTYFAHRVSDGQVLWSVKAPGRMWGSPVKTQVGDATILVTPQGKLIDVATGTVVVRSAFKAPVYNAPVVKDGVIYTVGHKNNFAVAVKLPATLAALKAQGVKTLWEKTVNKERYYSSPVIHDGLMYAITQKHMLTVLNAATGETVYEKKVPGLKRTNYMSIALAGDRFYVGDEGGLIVILHPGKTYQEIGRASVEPFRSTPIFKGDRMFLRTNKFLYCFKRQAR